MGSVRKCLTFKFPNPLVRATLLCALLLIVPGSVSAQQAYNNVSGYACTGRSTTCNSYALYRTQSSTETLASVATLFNTTASRVANSSGMNLTSEALAQQTPLYVELPCACRQSTYESDVTHRVVSGDTYIAIANNTYQGLTTYEAMEAANPTIPATNIQPGQALEVPLRCACPSTSQLNNGSKILLTYVIFPQESLYDLSTYFTVSISNLESANNNVSATSLQAFTTLLIPLATLPPLSSISFIVPPTPVAAPTPTTNSTSSTTSKKSNNAPLYIGIAVGASGLLLAAIFAVLLVIATHKHNRKRDNKANHRLPIYQSTPDSRTPFMPNNMNKDPVNGISNSSSQIQSDFAAEMSDMVGVDKPVIFSYQEVRDATKDFSEDCRLQGSVYLGELPMGSGHLVAIKQMKGNITQELKILGQVHHGNVVKLVGMCTSSEEHLFLVYEYAENGSLSDCLHYQIAYPSSSRFSRSTGLLTWITRVQIALDVASGLEYIHNYTNPSFVHKDVKTSNILLDSSFHAKVANFGMAKSANNSGDGPILTNHIVGTQGYMAPEYLQHGLVTTKADVFSFGVVLLELLSGQEATTWAHGGRDSSLSSQIPEVLEGDDKILKLQAWMDPQLQNAYPLEIAYSVASLAKICVDDDPALRPHMKDVTYALSAMLTSSLEWESTVVFKSHMSTMSVEAR